MNVFRVVESGKQVGSIFASTPSERLPGAVSLKLGDSTAALLTYAQALEMYRQLGNALVVAGGVRVAA